ncbi:MAG TPA: hypothetical protein VFZ17_07365 [Acidimicrobiia bacterium]|nr:hypothetical protein [Acidimicrobiia bacterium]
MKLRHLAAAGMIGAISVVGGAGIAAAQTSDAPAATHNKATFCEKATARLPKIQDRLAKVEQRSASLDTRLADAQAKNQEKRVEFLQERIDWTNTVHDHLTKVTDEINSYCAS